MINGDARDGDDLGRRRVTADHGDESGGRPEPVGEQGDDRLVGPPLLGRCGQLDLQGITEPAHDLVA